MFFCGKVAFYDWKCYWSRFSDVSIAFWLNENLLYLPLLSEKNVILVVGKKKYIFNIKLSSLL